MTRIGPRTLDPQPHADPDRAAARRAVSAGGAQGPDRAAARRAVSAGGAQGPRSRGPVRVPDRAAARAQADTFWPGPGASSGGMDALCAHAQLALALSPALMWAHLVGLALGRVAGTISPGAGFQAMGRGAWGVGPEASGLPPRDLALLGVALARLGSRTRTGPAGGGDRPRVGTADTGRPAPAAALRSPAATGAFARRLGDAAESVARRMGSTGWCYTGVADALALQGVTVTGMSAYMAADQLARMPARFQEVSVAPSALRDLPRGAVVVWGKTGASPDGHISVALGDGREASDHIQSQITALRGASNYRVFIPRG
jgi:hypothetical protein